MRAIPVFELRRRGGPLIISIPHLGKQIPDDLRDHYAPEAFALADTDWHLDRLYDFAEALDATVLQATVSRYVIDLNRPATGESLYPGMVTTGLCPTETFRGDALYLPGRAPEGAEVQRRVETYWRPYHEALQSELRRLRTLHPNVLLWEAHSIASVLPRLFEGKLPDFNFGTADGRSCHPSVAEGAVGALRASELSWVLNGRFKGGFITRNYGDPGAGIHAIQLELCQSLYMTESRPFAWRPELAGPTGLVVRSAVERALENVSLLGSAAVR